METASLGKNAGSKGKARLIPPWMVVMLILLVVAGLAYQQYRLQQDHYINRHFFRILNETTIELDTKLKQLLTVHKYSQSCANKRALFPSYSDNCESDGYKSPEQSEDPHQLTTDGKIVTTKPASTSRDNEKKPTTASTNNDEFELWLNGDVVEVHVTSEVQAERSEKQNVPSVDIADVFPSPKSGFALYLLVDKHNNVLSEVGGEQALSIVDTNDISLQIIEKKNQKWVNLLADEGKKNTGNGSRVPLPGSSYHIDSDLTSGPVRLFIYPFKSDLRIGPIPSADKAKPSGDKALAPTKTTLYLVGVLPENMLDFRDNRRWNLSLLIIAIVVLAFAWSLSRLFMMSANETLGDVFYHGTVFCSFALFVLLSSWLIAFGEQIAENESKQLQAQKVLRTISGNVETELFDIFEQLQNYQQYYQELLTILGPSNVDNTTDGLGKAVNAITHLVFEKDINKDIDKERLPIRGIKLCDGTRYQFRPEEFDITYIPLPASNLRDFCASTDNAQLDLIHFTGAGIKPVDGHRFQEWYDPEETDKNQRRPGNILSAFLMNSQGKQVLPQFSFTEINRPTKAYLLSHRDYFKKVRDKQGWTANLCSESGWDAKFEVCNRDTDDFRQWKNFYIQRLFNISNGTRGTTLGMPLVKSGTGEQNLQGMVLGADIELSALSLTEWSNAEELQDFVVMVIDQSTGEVLFHMDDDRTLIENLYQAGEGTADISWRIRAGKARGKRTVAGYYHGDAGRFMAKTLPLQQWALVVFIPDGNTESYMTNLFLANTISMASILLFFSLALWLSRKFLDTGSIKTRWSIPLVINHRRIMIFSAVFVASVYLAYWLGSAIDREYANPEKDLATAMMPILAMILSLLWGYYQYRKLYLESRQAQKAPVQYKNGALLMTLGFLLIGGLLTQYLHHVGKVPISSLYSWYFSRNVFPARLNQEREELKEIALSRFPNSITRYQVDPLSLMPVSEEWKKRLDSARAGVMPADIGLYSQLTYSTDSWQWIKRFLFAAVKYGGASDKAEGEFPRKLAFQHPFLMSIYFFVLCALWFLFNSRVLYVRLFGSPYFLRHLNQLANRKPTGKNHAPSSSLLIELEDMPPSGQNLELLLQQFKQHKVQGSPADDGNFLFSLCPLLEKAVDCDNPFPCTKIMLSEGETPRSILLWDIENSLAHRESRAFLLGLINQLKSALKAGKLKELKLYMGFHALERLLIKGERLSASETGDHQMNSLEYSAWSECLMDFRVELPQDIQEHLDPAFTRKECDELPLLRNLPDELATTQDVSSLPKLDELRWIELQDRKKTHAEWASINCILMKAGALFRFKWESCSPAEKLALFHLARHKRINPTNPQMMEQLALEGLIKVRKGRIRIANNSFAYFVRHAEDPNTLKDLVQRGHEGAWQNYRLPVTLFIVLAIVAIALTSGNSLFMIFASFAGLLGTIGTLTSSTRMIRDNLGG